MPRPSHQHLGGYMGFGRHGLFERGALAYLAGAADGIYETLLEDIVTPRLLRWPADACNVSLH